VAEEVKPSRIRTLGGFSFYLKKLLSYFLKRDLVNFNRVCCQLGVVPAGHLRAGLPLKEQLREQLLERRPE